MRIVLPRTLLLLAVSLTIPACGGGGSPPPPGTLSGLVVSSGTLNPAFNSQVWTYAIGPGLMDSTVTVTATAVDAGSVITVNGTPVASGVPSAPIAVPPGMSTLTIVVTPPGEPSQTYIILIERAGVVGQEAYLKASNPGMGDGFGHRVAISGDLLVTGAPWEDSGATGVNGTQADESAVDSGAAYVFRRTGTTWVQEAYLKASNTDASDHFGWNVAISGDTVVVGAHSEAGNAAGVDGNEADNSMPGAGAAYVFRRTGGTWAQEAYLKSSNPDGSDFFGESVAISGDTIVVGAYFESSNATGVGGNDGDNSAPRSGAAYVFTRTGSVWTPQAYLKASNPETEDRFGFTVGVSGDTIVVGAPGESSNATGVNGNEADNSVSQSGAAYVFTRTGGVWSQQAYLKASTVDAVDTFGRVGISGDTIVVSAPGEDSNATGVNGNEADNSAFQSGAAYVFTRTGGVWSQQAYLKASNAGASDWFGYGVGISGDAIVLSARNESSGATGIDGDGTDNSEARSGAAYVFVRTAGAWSQQAYLKASNTETFDFFGYGVGISGDTVGVGAVNEDSGAAGVNGNEADNGTDAAGAVYVFR